VSTGGAADDVVERGWVEERTGNREEATVVGALEREEVMGLDEADGEREDGEEDRERDGWRLLTPSVFLRAVALGGVAITGQSKRTQLSTSRGEDGGVALGWSLCQAVVDIVSSWASRGERMDGKRKIEATTVKRGKRCCVSSLVLASTTSDNSSVVTMVRCVGCRRDEWSGETVSAEERSERESMSSEQDKLNPETTSGKKT
jgi:hypothetical protein